jgi:hypothetical protein
MGFYALMGLWGVWSIMFIVTNWAESEMAAIAAGFLVAIITLLPFTLIMAAITSVFRLMVSAINR